MTAKRELKTQKTQQELADRAWQKAVAMQIATDYCEKHNLSKEKLQKQRFSLIYGSAFFMQDSDVPPMGLVNDMETMPKPTLIIKQEKGSIKVEETEFTHSALRAE
jgi:hypothetical protein